MKDEDGTLVAALQDVDIECDADLVTQFDFVE